jgi:anthranilate/para-aminobenzoate synthase component II
MINIIKKNILYIKNFSSGKNLYFLKKYFNINIKCIDSNLLINYTIDNLKKLIELYDIIIIGGGKQHLTSNNIFLKYPEIKNQIEIVKLISMYYKKNKLLIGICLGCQIIALCFGLKIVQMKKLCLGFDNLDITTINYNYINNYKDIYLNKINYKLLAKSFSFHYDNINYIDCIDNNIVNNELVIIAKSNEGIPYIIKHLKSKIYGFQFHPEACLESIINIFEYDTFINKSNIELEKITTHFFDIFINN